MPLLGVLSPAHNRSIAVSHPLLETPLPVRRLYDILSEAATIMEAGPYAGLTFYFVGVAPDGDPAKEFRVPAFKMPPRLARAEGEPGRPSLDGAVSALVAYLEACEPETEWAGFTFKRPGRPPCSFNVSPRPCGLPPGPR
jgi:hypothetical protein